MIMRRNFPVLLCFLGLMPAKYVQAQGFAALVSPPRFELATKPGKTLRGVIEISNRSTAPGHYVIHTADWNLARDFSVTFQDSLQPDSCRPWVSLERPAVEILGGGTMRYRFEVTVPADAPAGECRFAVMIEGAEPSIAMSQGLSMPVTGTWGTVPPISKFWDQKSRHSMVSGSPPCVFTTAARRTAA
jgi:fimbrial chaperone protein